MDYLRWTKKMNRPAVDDSAGPVPLRPFELLVGSRVAEEMGDEERPLTAELPLLCMNLFVKEAAAVVDIPGTLRHAFICGAVGMNA
ncbi:MAG: hypothetical protein IAF94_12820 [Pirellulaceae bacterium]|nr:hypothetical protein [Pirellulaceae bacterium]